MGETRRKIKSKPSSPWRFRTSTIFFTSYIASFSWFSKQRLKQASFLTEETSVKTTTKEQVVWLKLFLSLHLVESPLEKIKYYTYICIVNPTITPNSYLVFLKGTFY